MRQALALLAALLSCCAVPVPPPSRAAIEAAWRVAETSCMETQQLIAAREALGKQTAAETDAQLAAVRVKCDAVTAAFEALQDAP